MEAVLSNLPIQLLSNHDNHHSIPCSTSDKDAAAAIFDEMKAGTALLSGDNNHPTIAAARRELMSDTDFSEATIALSQAPSAAMTPAGYLSPEGQQRLLRRDSLTLIRRSGRFDCIEEVQERVGGDQGAMEELCEVVDGADNGNVRGPDDVVPKKLLQTPYPVIVAVVGEQEQMSADEAVVIRSSPTIGKQEKKRSGSRQSHGSDESESQQGYDKPPSAAAAAQLEIGRNSPPIQHIDADRPSTTSNDCHVTTSAATATADVSAAAADVLPIAVASKTLSPLISFANLTLSAAHRKKKSYAFVVGGGDGSTTAIRPIVVAVPGGPQPDYLIPESLQRHRDRDRNKTPIVANRATSPPPLLDVSPQPMSFAGLRSPGFVVRASAIVSECDNHHHHEDTVARDRNTIANASIGSGSSSKTIKPKLGVLAGMRGGGGEGERGTRRGTTRMQRGSMEGDVGYAATGRGKDEDEEEEGEEEDDTGDDAKVAEAGFAIEEWRNAAPVTKRKSLLDEVTKQVNGAFARSPSPHEYNDGGGGGPGRKGRSSVASGSVGSEVPGNGRPLRPSLRRESSFGDGRRPPRSSRNEPSSLWESFLQTFPFLSRRKVRFIALLPPPTPLQNTTSVSGLCGHSTAASSSFRFRAVKQQLHRCMCPISSAMCLMKPKIAPSATTAGGGIFSVPQMHHRLGGGGGERGGGGGGGGATLLTSNASFTRQNESFHHGLLRDNSNNTNNNYTLRTARSQLETTTTTRSYFFLLTSSPSMPFLRRSGTGTTVLQQPPPAAGGGRTVT